MNGKILIGDVLEKIKEIPDESIDCIITSPPYWGLRDYGTGRWEGGDPNCDHSTIRHKTREERGGLTELQAGSKGGFGDEKKWTSDTCPNCNAKRIDPQWGLEMDFHDYLDKLDKLMDECRRVLKKTGTCWVNLGDTYASSGGASRHYGHGQYEDPKYANDKGGKFVDPQTYPQGVTTKSRMGIPERFYIRCIDKGWVARNHIPWIKANSMPSSVKDRFTNKWESVFFFAKNKKYYFDLDAVRVPPKTGYGVVKSKSKGKRKSLEVLKQQESMSKFGFANKHNYGLHERRERGEAVSNCHPKGKNPGDVFRESDAKTKDITSPSGSAERTLVDLNTNVERNKESRIRSVLNGKNPGDVFRDKAVYDKSKPYAVVEREGVIYYRNLPEHEEVIDYLNKAKKNAGFTIDQLEEIFDNYTPHHWFEKDGSYPTKEDWVKVKEILKFDDTYDEAMTKEYVKSAEKIDNPKGKNPGDVFEINTKPCKEAHFATFPPTLPEKILKCSCPKGGTVLDPFFGAGTVGLIAEQLNLNWIGIELKPEYVEIAKKRIGDQEKITQHIV